MTARTGIPKQRLKNFRLNRASPTAKERNKIVEAMQGGYDVEHALRHAHVTKPSEIQLKAMQELEARNRCMKLAELIRQKGNPEAIALKMTTGKRTAGDARALITRLLRGWRIGQKEVRIIEDALRNLSPSVADTKRMLVPRSPSKVSNG